MKTKNFFTTLAVLVSISLLFTACPEPGTGPDNPQDTIPNDTVPEKPEEPVVVYDAVKLVGNCIKSDYSASDWMYDEPAALGGASKLTAEKLSTAGKKIIGIRVRIDSEVEDFKVFLGEDYQNPELVKSAKWNDCGWQYVLFDKPYEIPADKDLYIGWEGNTKSLILEEMRKTVPDEMAKFENRWMSIGDFCKDQQIENSFGVISMVAWPLQAICVEGDYSQEARKTDAVIDNAPVKPYVVVGETQRIEVDVRNMGILTLKDVEVKANAGAASVSVTLPAPLMNGQSVRVNLDLVQQASSYKTQDVAVEVAVPDDQVIKDNTVTFAGQRIYNDKGYTRNAIIVEQFTGQKCGNCPGGAAGMKKAIEGLPDEDEGRVAWVAHHSGYGKDQFTLDESDQIATFLSVPGAPYCNINRMEQTLGSGELPMLLWHPKSAKTQMLALLLDEPGSASLEVKSQYNSSSRTFTVTLSGKTSEADAYLTAIITQSGIVAEQSGAGIDYEHNHAPRKFLTPAIGEKLELGADGSFSKEYTYTIPEKVGSFDCVPEDMDLVVYLHGNIKGASKRHVYNADCIAITTGEKR